MTAPEFHDLARALDAERSEVQAAECHGCLCGALCASADYNVREWLDEMLPDGTALASGSDSNATFNDVFERTRESLGGDQMEFEPLLPDDDAPLKERAIALAEWCQGFLYGFGTAGHVRGKSLPEEVDEVLADFAQVSRATDGEDAGEVEEQAYAEIVEFLRVATQLVYDQLAPLRESQRKPTQTH